LAKPARISDQVFRHLRRQAAGKFQRIPVRNDVPLDSLPAWVKEAMTGIRAMPMDRVILEKHLDEWMRYWDANIRRRQ